MRKYKRSVFKALSILTQLGISIMVPTAICVGIGVFIDSKFGTWWTIPLLFLGMIAGGRNAFILAMSVVKSNDNPELSDEVKKQENEDGKDRKQ